MTVAVIPEHATEKDGVWSWFQADSRLNGCEVGTEDASKGKYGVRRVPYEVLYRPIDAPFTPGEAVILDVNGKAVLANVLSCEPRRGMVKEEPAGGLSCNGFKRARGWLVTAKETTP